MDGKKLDKDSMRCIISTDQLKIPEKDYIQYPLIDMLLNHFQKVERHQTVTMNKKVYSKNDMKLLLKKIYFISNDVLSFINERKTIDCTEIKNKDYCLHVYRFDNEEVDLQFIIYLIESIKQLSKRKKPFMIYLFLTPLKKVLPKNNVFQPENINSGVTMDNIIVIWRKEEIFKVLIHELIHFFQLDFSELIYSKNKEYQVNMIEKNKLLKTLRLFKTDGLTINEAYTETIATIINVIVVALEIKRLDLINFFLNTEMKFTLIQVAKILSHIGMKSIKCLIDKDMTPCKSEPLIEKTRVFSYFFVKSLMLYFPDDFFKLFFRDTDFKEFTEFIDVILKDLHQPEYIEIVDNTIDIYKNELSFNDNFFSKTTRMTAVSLSI
jgi:hypothetical protein